MEKGNQTVARPLSMMEEELMGLGKQIEAVQKLAELLGERLYPVLSIPSGNEGKNVEAEERQILPELAHNVRDKREKVAFIGKKLGDIIERLVV